MREGGEQEVGVGEEFGLGRDEPGLLEDGVAGQLRVDGGHGGPGVSLRGQRAELEVRMAGQQAQQFAARVAACSRDRYPRTHVNPLAPLATLKEYSCYRMNMQTGWGWGGRAWARRPGARGPEYAIRLARRAGANRAWRAYG